MNTSEILILLEKSFEGLFPLEDNHFDWKIDISPNTKRLAEHFSAFSNQHDGGYLIFGIGNDGKTLRSPTQAQRDLIISKLSSIARSGLEPAVRIDFGTLIFRGKDLLVVHIFESAQKPVHIRGKTMDFSFIRSGGSTRRMVTEEIRQALLSSSSTKIEQLPSIQSVKEEGLAHILDLSGYESLLKRQKIFLEPLKDELIKHGLIRSSASKTGHFDILNLGMLVCGQDFNTFSRGTLSVRVISYQDSSRLHATSEEIFNSGYAVSLEKILNYIERLLPMNEIIQKTFRVTRPLYPIVAIRELLANAVIHQLLARDAGYVLIEIFSDRIEFANPGSLLPNIQLKELINAYPQSRNELFAKEMRQLGICEERGSGIDRAIEAIESYGLPPVRFEQNDTSFKATIFAPKSHKNMTPEERTEACYQHCCLMQVSGKKMTNRSLRERLGTSSQVSANRVIQDSLNSGLIKIGNPTNRAPRYRYYVPYWA